MKLRNKKTGEIGLVHCDATMFSNKIGLFIDNNHIDLRNPYKIYTSLAELNEEWEDYEEPKTFWAISWAGEPEEYDAKKTPQELKDMAEEIGNYFESKEEAEKALEKLRAWKRLKNKGFKADPWDYDGGNYQERIRTVRMLFRVKDYKENDTDLDLLFGGEE